jgi:ABC-type multidrug transport system ATPase subunit
MAEAEDLCHRLAILNHGQIQLTGSMQELRNALRVEDVHVLAVTAVDELALASLSGVPGLHSLKVTPAEGLSAYRLEAAVQRGSAAVPTIIRRIVQEGGDVWSSTPQELSLEGMFAIAMGRDQPVSPGWRSDAASANDRAVAVGGWGPANPGTGGEEGG